MWDGEDDGLVMNDDAMHARIRKDQRGEAQGRRKLVIGRERERVRGGRRWARGEGWAGNCMQKKEAARVGKRGLPESIDT